MTNRRKKEFDSFRSSLAVAILLLVGAVLGQDEQCTDVLGGTCQDYTLNVCTAGYTTGVCSGNNDRRCCLPCDASCQADEDTWHQSDGQCEAAGGNCQLVSNYCSSSYEGGICGGPNDRECCKTIASPDPEFRAVFMATVQNIDWPAYGGQDPDLQKADMVEYLNLFDAMNSNAVMFQVRPAGDAFYNSAIEPWSEWLSGTQGFPPSPFYDPLSFTIDEAHARGIEVHVWLNPYRAAMSPSSAGLASNHACVLFNQYCYPYGANMWLDPGSPEVADRLIEVVEDLTSNYDIDGLHFDDYFYPYPVDGTPFPDSATFAQYGNGMSLEDWRRDNVNRMVSRVEQTIHGIKPTCKFSISPFGIYRSGDPEGMPPPIVGFDPYSEQYADTKLWLQSGWVDFLAPQLYWKIDPPAQSYPTLLDWWISPEVNTLGRYVYAANAVYRIEDNGWPSSEIINQVAISRDSDRRAKGSLGNIHFSAKYFRDNTDGITSALTAIQANPVSIPPMPWLGESRNPDSLEIIQIQSSKLKLSPIKDETIRFWSVFVLVEDNNEWKMLKKLPKSRLEWDIPAEVHGKRLMIRSVDGANRMSKPVYFHG